MFSPLYTLPSQSVLTYEGRKEGRERGTGQQGRCALSFTLRHTYYFLPPSFLHNPYTKPLSLPLITSKRDHQQQKDFQEK